MGDHAKLGCCWLNVASTYTRSVQITGLHFKVIKVIESDTVRSGTSDFLLVTVIVIVTELWAYVLPFPR